MFVALGALPGSYKRFFDKLDSDGNGGIYGVGEAISACVCFVLYQLCSLMCVAIPIMVELELEMGRLLKGQWVVFQLMTVITYYVGIGLLGRATTKIHIVALELLNFTQRMDNIHMELNG